MESSIVVSAAIDDAFRVFTQDFGRFKPKEHNLLGVDIVETVFEPGWEGVANGVSDEQGWPLYLDGYVALLVPQASAADD